MKSNVPTIALTALLVAAAGATAAELPRLGSSADTILSPHEARMIGGNMLHQLRAHNLVLDDPQLRNYINELGYRLLAHTTFPKDMTFTFFVMRDNTINAFAVPGGYIGVHTGLITATESEDELASVLAHEIAHITQHHAQRSMEDARKMAPLSALVMLGAVLASQAGGSGDAGPAIVAGGIGAMAQRRINFTRKDEAEADRIGISTLAAAGFDPDAMAGFFGRMEQLLRPGSGGVQVPALLRTHPVTSQRISEARARARGLKQEQKEQPQALLGSRAEWRATMAPLPYVSPGEILLKPTHDNDSTTSNLNYQLMRERARVLAASNTRDVLKYYTGNLAAKKSFDSTANRYGYALALARNSEADKAMAQLQPLLAKHDDNLALQLAMAYALLHAGQRSKALARYHDLHQDMPQNHAVAEAYATALLANGKSDAAAKAAEVLRPLLAEEVDEPTLYRTYGRACALSDQDVRAAEAFADATYLSGHAADALGQLQRLLKRDDRDYYQRARIQARIDFITPIVLELRRRGYEPYRRSTG